jgi:hypothetical protein
MASRAPPLVSRHAPARIVLYTASIAAFSVLVRSLVIGPLPLWLAGRSWSPTSG